MGFSVSLRDKQNKPVQVDVHNEGHTIAIDKPFFIDNTIYGGTSDAEMDITFNYNEYFHEALHPEGLMFLDKKTGKQAIPYLKNAIFMLGTQRHYDYWAATPGNAGHALAVLLTWAEQYPAATFIIRN